MFAQVGMVMMMAIGLSGSAAAVKTFSEERPVFWREASAGHGRLAYFLGNTWATLYRFRSRKCQEKKHMCGAVGCSSASKADGRRLC